MKRAVISLTLSLAVVVSVFAQQDEFDDVYFTKKDRKPKPKVEARANTAVSADAQQRSKFANPDYSANAGNSTYTATYNYYDSRLALSSKQHDYNSVHPSYYSNSVLWNDPYYVRNYGCGCTDLWRPNGMYSSWGGWSWGMGSAWNTGWGWNPYGSWNSWNNWGNYYGYGYYGSSWYNPWNYNNSGWNIGKSAIFNDRPVQRISRGPRGDRSSVVNTGASSQSGRNNSSGGGRSGGSTNGSGNSGGRSSGGSSWGSGSSGNGSSDWYNSGNSRRSSGADYGSGNSGSGGRSSGSSSGSSGGSSGGASGGSRSGVRPR